MIYLAAYLVVAVVFYGLLAAAFTSRFSLNLSLHGRLILVFMAALWPVMFIPALLDNGSDLFKHGMKW